MDAVHAGDCGMASATDEVILATAGEEGRIVITLDADFHALLALSGAAGPSVVRIRMEGLKGDAAAALIRDVLEACADDLARGALVSVSENQLRVHHLPIGR